MKEIAREIHDTTYGPLGNAAAIITADRDNWIDIGSYCVAAMVVECENGWSVNKSARISGAHPTSQVRPVVKKSQPYYIFSFL
jgi:hypothetical protein